MVSLLRAPVALVQQIHRLDGVAEVGDHDGATDDERDVECVVQLLVGETGFDALDEVVVDAVVATENGGGDEAEEFFRPPIERTVTVSGRVEAEEALDAEVGFLVEDAAIHPRAVRVEGVEAVCVVAGAVESGAHRIGGCILRSAVYARTRPAIPPRLHRLVKNSSSQLRAEKEAFRARFRAARATLAPEEAAARSAALCDRIAALPEIRNAETVHVYWPLVERREVDTRPLICLLEAQGKRIVLPVVAAFDGAPTLRHVVFAGEEQTRPNRWGLLEPHATPEVDPAVLDVVVVPAFGAGRNGHRIGHGRGFYDAFLAAIDAPTIGAVYANCLVETVPAEPHDVPLDVIVTEREVWRVRPFADGVIC